MVFSACHNLTCAELPYAQRNVNRSGVALENCTRGLARHRTVWGNISAEPSFANNLTLSDLLVCTGKTTRVCEEGGCIIAWSQEDRVGSTTGGAIAMLVGNHPKSRLLNDRQEDMLLIR